MSEDRLPRIALGTAQLGMRYGIANMAGKPGMGEAVRIVQSAFGAGVGWYDTAQAYGDSEAVLGDCLQSLGLEKRVRVVSKLDPGIGVADASMVERSVLGSLKRLHLERLDGFLLHRDELVRDLGGEFGSRFADLGQQGLVLQLGASCYSADVAARAMRYDFIQMVQLPGSVFDRRIARCGIVHLATRKRCTLFVRSVYLQGLALMDVNAVPSDIPMARDAVGKLVDFCASHRIGRKRFCLHYAMRRFSPAILVIGVEHTSQIAETVALALADPPADDLFDDWDREWPEDVAGLVNPSLWPK